MALPALRTEHSTLHSNHGQWRTSTGGRSKVEIGKGRVRPAGLQVLAFYAHDHFGEDGFPYEESVPSSFDIVVDVYAREADSAGHEEICAHACDAIIERLQVQRRAPLVERPLVDEFVEMAVTYLRSQYPKAAQAAEERQMLTNLFWGNLVAARLAD